MSSIPHHPPTPGASTTKNLPGQSCLVCRQRKVKCDKLRPCSACSKARLDCVFSDASPARSRKRKAPEASVLERLRRYEELLKGAGVDVDALEASRGTLDGDSEEHDTDTATPDPALDELRKRSKAEPGQTRDTKPLGSETGRLIVEEGKSRYLENHLWRNLGNEILQATSDDHAGTYIQPSPDATDHHGADLILGFTPTNVQLESFHPQPMHVSRLWQTFLENVNPLTKFVYTPTVQEAIRERIENRHTLSKGMEALIFAIYSSAIVSLSDTECEKMFNEARATLLARYHLGTRQALIASKFLQSSELITLQAFVLFLLSARQHYDHRTLWTFTGTAIRISQAIGLHRDGTSLGVSPFETEMRRRLWWQIIALDGRIAELSGLGISILAHHWDTKPPLNILDSDLTPDMKETTTEQVGATEMIFCLIRYEIGDFLHRSGSESNNYFLRMGNAAMSPGSKERALDELENHLEGKFLRYCDPSIRLHFFTAIVARSAVCGLRLAAHDLRHTSEKAVHMPKGEKDILFSNSVKIIEYDNLIQSTKSVQGYLWHVRNHFQWHAFIYMLNELRTRTIGEEVDNAWQRIDEVYEYHPELVTDTKKALHVAIGALVLKVWAAREASLIAPEQQQHYQSRAGGTFPHDFAMEPPAYVAALRAQREHTSTGLRGSGGGGGSLMRPDYGQETPAGDHIHSGPYGGGSGEGDGHQQQYPSGHGMAEAATPGIAPDSYFQLGDAPLLFDSSPMDWGAWDDLLQNYES